MPPPPPAPNIRTFRISQRVNPPHEKSPYDLSTSTIKSKATITTSIEELPKSFTSQSNKLRFNELKGESVSPSIHDYLPPAQLGSSFDSGTFFTSNIYHKLFIP